MNSILCCWCRCCCVLQSIILYRNKYIEWVQIGWIQKTYRVPLWRNWLREYLAHSYIPQYIGRAPPPPFSPPVFLSHTRARHNHSFTYELVSTRANSHLHRYAGEAEFSVFLDLQMCRMQHHHSSPDTLKHFMYAYERLLLLTRRQTNSMRAYRKHNRWTST